MPQGVGKECAQQGAQGSPGLVFLALYLFCLLWDLVDVEMIDVGNSAPFL